MRKNETIILVHGFNKSETDMFPLKKHLLGLGYQTVTVTLPTLLGSLEQCVIILETRLKELNISTPKVHFVGHSLGGLIIRSFLAQNHVSSLGSCVFIASPNHGTKLADMVYNVFPPLLAIFKPLIALRTNHLNISPPLNNPSPLIGVIAGNKSNLFLGKFLENENDGRVEVNSTKIKEMNDFVIVPYGHKEIHHHQEVALLVDSFLQKGKFELPK